MTVYYLFYVLVVPLEQLYATQLSQLQETDSLIPKRISELYVLVGASGGNVQAALTRLIGNFGP